MPFGVRRASAGAVVRATRFLARRAPAWHGCCVTPERFLARCPTIWHVAAGGAWDIIKVLGLRTAQQLIVQADLDSDTREELLTTPRRVAVPLTVDGAKVTLRDQGPLCGVRNLRSKLHDGLEVADWIRILNARVYFFTDRAARQKILQKYVALDGAQDVLTISPLRLLTTAGPRLKLSDRNTGAIARKAEPYKGINTFVSVARFRIESQQRSQLWVDSPSTRYTPSWSERSVTIRTDRQPHSAERRRAVLALPARRRPGDSGVAFCSRPPSTDRRFPRSLAEK